MNEQGSGDGGDLPVVPPEVPRAFGPVRVKVGIILTRETNEHEIFRVYRSRLAEGGTIDEIEQAFIAALGRAIETWGTPTWPCFPERLRMPEALRDIHPEGRRLRWESEGKAEALAELLEHARAVVEGAPISDRSGATDHTRIERLRAALETFEALP